MAGNGTLGSYSGNGVPAGSAEFASPYSLAVDRHGNIYICDTYNRSIRVVNTGTSADYSGYHNDPAWEHCNCRW